MPGFQPPTEGPPLERRPSERVQLRCIVFLKSHFENGGINQQGFDMLTRMIELISATCWEVHLIFQSKMATARSIERVELSMDCILQGCSILDDNMEKASMKAKDAANRLPALGDEPDEILKTKLRQWQWKLKTLHDPTGNDKRLFIMILDHYSDAFERILQLHQRKPAYGLKRMVDRAIQLRNALDGLVRLACEADRRVMSLQRKYWTASTLFAARKAGNDSLRQVHPAMEPLPAATYQPPIAEVKKILPSAFSKSFGVAEEQVARKRHGPTEHRRRCSSTPRIFTESLSELEKDVQRLQLDKVKTPETPENMITSTSVRVRDLDVTRVDSPSHSQSPPTLLQRREAVVSKETEVQARIIKGAIVSSRRPSTKERPQATGSARDLEAWKNNETTKLPDLQG